MSGIQHEHSITISIGKSRNDINWKIEEMTCEEFIKLLQVTRRTGETMAEYDQLTRDEKGEIKDGKAFVGGFVRGGRRKRDSVESRSLITLDADFADPYFMLSVDCRYGGNAGAIYSTHSSRPEKEKYRYIAVLSRDATPDEYAAISRWMANKIGMNYFDHTTFEVNRLMYFPSCSKDAEPVIHVYEGPPINVDAVLAEYGAAGLDWKYPAHWPKHPKEKAVRLNGGKKPQDPRDKRGAVGLFCRAFTLEEGIDTLLADEYTAGSMTDRYTYTGGTSGNGLEVFHDQQLAFSHQDSDPVADGHSHNLFDLVRIHKFGHLDEDIDKETIGIDERPSHLEMVKLVMGLDVVQQLEKEESAAEIQSAFGNAMDDVESDESEKLIDVSNIHIPTGFKIIKGQIFEVRELKNEIKYVPVCDCIVAVTARFESLTDGTQGLDVMWNSHNGTRKVSNTRSTFVDSKKIINLSDYGLPVHSGNARNLATYISRFESANEQNLETRQVSNQLGWTKGGFLLGDMFIGDKEVQFQPKDGGDAQIAKGFHTNGTMEGTIDVLNKIKQFPMVKMAIYAALSAPLLKKWNESPYIFELAGTTSRGKTTALRIAASLYGCPDESKPGFFRQWNATKVSLERYASIMNNLPLFIDDTKNGDADRVIKPMIYQFASGQGKGRGSTQGMQISANWQTVLLSTGEQKITSFAKDGGAVARVLSMEGSPFTDTDINAAREVQNLNKQVSEHYGHVAEPWIRFLQTTDMKPWKKKFASTGDKYTQLAHDAGPVAMRLSRIMALIDVVGEMFDACFGLSLHVPDELIAQWNQFTQGATEMDRATEAFESVMGWVASRKSQFIVNGLSPYSGDTLGEIRKDELIIIDGQLDAYLITKGYNPGAISKAWKEKGWLETLKNRTKKQHRINSGQPYVYWFDLKKMGWSFDLPDRNSEFDEPPFLV